LIINGILLKTNDRSTFLPKVASSDHTIVGLQLIVSRLERQNTRSAAAHLHRILKDYREKRPNLPFPAILITPYLSIDTAASAVPRPAWLEDIRDTLLGPWPSSYLEGQQ